MKFQPFHDSEKARSSTLIHSLPHGKYGIGRLTFFLFAQLARWTTVYNEAIDYSEFIINQSIINVSELKHPAVPLGEKELSQLKSYMRVIQKPPRFNGSKHKWTYILIGNRFNGNGYMDGEIRSHKNSGERNLVHEDGNHKIYVFTWSDIFADFSYKHEYLLEKLRLDEKIWLEKHTSANEIIENIKGNTAVMQRALIQTN